MPRWLVLNMGEMLRHFTGENIDRRPSCGCTTRLMVAGDPAAVRARLRRPESVAGLGSDDWLDPCAVSRIGLKP